MLSVVIAWVFIKRIENGHNEFVPRFVEGKIEPSYFTLRLKNIPVNDWYNGMQPLLTAMLYEKL